MSFLPIHNQSVPVTGTPCLIPLVGDCVRAGCPSPAENLAAMRIDLTAATSDTRLLVEAPAAGMRAVHRPGFNRIKTGLIPS